MTDRWVLRLVIGQQAAPRPEVTLPPPPPLPPAEPCPAFAVLIDITEVATCEGPN